MDKIKRKIIISAIPLVIIAGFYFYSSHLSGNLQADARFTGYEAVPVIMYHGLIRDPALQTDYYISPDVFESDLVYLKENGYNTVFISELIDYVYEGIPLPEKPVLLTFDDGYYNNYYYAYPLLKQYNMKASISIIGIYTDMFSRTDENNAAYSHLTWTQLKEMAGSGLVEVLNHSYNMHNLKERQGILKKDNESETEYRKLLNKDVVSLQRKIKKHLGKTPCAFTYPFGFYSDYEEELIEDLGFKATLSCTEKINYISPGDKDSLYRLNRFLRTGDMSSSAFFEIKKAASPHLCGP